jgi:hypothetical protein
VEAAPLRSKADNAAALRAAMVLLPAPCVGVAAAFVASWCALYSMLGLSAHRLAGSAGCFYAHVHEVVGPSSQVCKHVYYAVCLCSGVCRTGRL